MLSQAERLRELKSFFETETKNKTSGKENIFAFVSGKGGTGKTFLSLNIAHELAAMNKKVLYADLDLNMANAHVMLNLNPQKTISDFLSGRILIEDLVTRYNDNLHLILGDSGKSNFFVNDTLLKDFISKIKSLKEFDVIILDLAAGAGNNIFIPLQFCSYVIVTATTEPTSVMDAYAIMKLMMAENLKSKKLILFNKVRNEEDAATAFNNLNSALFHFLKIESELLGFINYSSEAYEAVQSQKLISEDNSDSDLLFQINQTALRIIDIIQLANIHHSSSF